MTNQLYDVYIIDKFVIKMNISTMAYIVFAKNVAEERAVYVLQR